MDCSALVCLFLKSDYLSLIVSAMSSSWTCHLPSSRQRRPVPFLLLLLALLLFCLSCTYAAGVISAPNSTFTTAPVSPASITNLAARTLILQAFDSTGLPLSSGGSLFSASLFTTNPTCDTNITTPHCLVTCSPSLSPFSASPGCISSPFLPSLPATSPNYVPITVTDLQTGQYQLTYYPQHPDTYTLYTSLLTQGGLTGTYYNNVWFLAPYAQQRVDAQLNFNWGTGAITAYAVDYVSVRWRGVVMAGFSELYTFYATADDWVRVWVDRRLVIEAWGSGVCCNETWGSVNLTAGYAHDLIVDYVELTGSASLRLQWRSASTPKQVVPSTAFYYRTGVQSTPYSSIVITPGLPSAATSHAYDNDTVTLGSGGTGGLSASTAGVTTSVLLQAIDVFGNYNTNVTTNWSSLTAAMVGADPSPTIVWSYIANGIYRVNYTVVVSGSYLLYIRIAGINIASSPFTVTVAPGATAPAQSQLIGLPSTCTSGVTCTFYVEAKDALGNNRSTTASSDTVYVSWLNLNTSLSYLGLVSSPSNGLYYCYFTPTVTGAYNLTVYLNSVLMTGTNPPLLVNVVYGALSSPASTSSISGVISATAGIATSFTVTSRDAFGNVISAAGATYTYVITNSVSGATTASGSLGSAGSGTYSTSFTLNTVGTYTLAVTSNGVAVSGSPYTVVVSAGALSGATSYVPSPTPNTTALVSGVATTFSIQSRDAYGNAISVGGASFAGSLQCSTVTVAAIVIDLGTGVYSASVTPTVAASACALYVYLSSPVTNVLGSPFSVAVVAGAATGNSTATGTALTIGTAGVSSSVTVKAYDAAANALTTGNSPVVMTVTPRSPLNSTSTPTVAKYDYNTGNYTFTYTPTAAGTYTTAIALLVTGGLRATYYSDTAFTVPYNTRVDPHVNFTWTGSVPFAGMLATAYYSVSWVGKVVPAYTATYTFYVQTIADTGVQLSVGGSTLIAALNPAGGSTYSYASMTLTAGVSYDFTLLYTTQESGGAIQLLWSATSYFTQTLIPASAFQYIDPVVSSPWITNIVPTASSATSSSYSVSPPSFKAAQAVFITVTLRDRFGNAQSTTTEAASLSAAIVVNSVYTYSSTFISAAAGTYTTSITPLIAGSATLTVTYNAVIIGSTLVTTVAVGPLSAPNCYVMGTLIPVYAGVPQSFVVQVQDTGNNTLSYDVTTMANGNIPLVVTMISTSPSLSIPSTISYIGSGQYSVSYTPVTAAQYSLTITFAGAPIRHSPYALTVLAGAASSATTTLVSALSNLTANEQAVLALVNTYDAYGNLDASGGYEFVVRLYNKSTPTSNVDLILASVRDYGNGTYAILYNSSAPGEYTGDILLAAGQSTSSGGAGSGLMGSYYNNRWLSGTPALTRVDPSISFDWGGASALTAITPTARDYISISWTGYLRINDSSGTYTFTVTASDGARLYVNSLQTPLFDQFTGSGGGSGSGTVTFPNGGGVLYDVRMDYRHNVAAANVQFNWSCSSCLVSPIPSSVVVPTMNLYPSASVITGGMVDVFVM